MSKVFNEDVNFNNYVNFFDTVNIFGKLEVIRDVSISGNSNIVGNLSVLGNSTIGGNSTIVGNVTANSFIRSGGASNAFLKADGSIDTTTYITAATVGGAVDNTGGQLVLRSGTGGFSAGIVTATKFVGNGTIPIGGIIMWSGTIASIPTGWALCDGTNSTPDLRNRFIVGAHSGAGTGITSTTGPGFSTTTGALSSDYTPGNTGGKTAHQLTIAELASHNHSLSGLLPTSPSVISPYDGWAAGNRYTNSTTGTSGNTGGDNYHENRPPYYALAFIMRTA